MGSTVLITGASKGIGAAFAEQLAARGMNLVLVARSLEALESLAKRLSDQYGVQCVALNADLADPDVTQRIAAELERRGIQVDLLATVLAPAAKVPFDTKEIPPMRNSEESTAGRPDMPEHAGRRKFLMQAGGAAGVLAVAQRATSVSPQSSPTSSGTNAESSMNSVANGNGFWPNGARLAVSISLMFEGGGQPISGAGGPIPEPIAKGVPDLPTNAFFAYGHYEGIPRARMRLRNGSSLTGTTPPILQRGAPSVTGLPG
jgi:hypothetical protein